MTFDRYIPCDLLKPFVETFVISESPEENAYKVLPDTGVVIGFQYKGKLSHIENKKQLPLSSAGVTGLRDTYRIFQNSADTGSVLVFFKPGGAIIFFKQPLHELFSESVSLDNFMLRSELLLLEEQLYEAPTHPEKISVIERFLVSRLRPAEQDKLVQTALALIYKSKGNIRIKELAAQLHISQSPLEKRFRHAVGASPKKFASIVRFKQTLKNYQPGNSLTELGYESGFYDQAHFIKEFKSLTGETPDNFFKQQ